MFEVQKETAALASIAASAAIAAAKAVAGLLSGSLALMSEAAHAAVDTGGTIITWLAIREANKPADAEHHYGHAKYEALAALIETALLLALTGFITVEAIRRLMHGETPIRAEPIAFCVLIFSIIVDLVRWRSLMKVARATNSQALEADALHFSSDLVASVCVLIGLIAVAFGYAQADAYAAFGVAAFVGIAGIRLGKRTIDTLLDAAPKGIPEQLESLVAATPGVVKIDFLRLRSTGAHFVGEVGICVARTLSVERVAQISKNITQKINDYAPGAEISVIASPITLDDESVRERVLLIVAREKLSAHNVSVQHVNKCISISLNLEIASNLTHGASHEAATRIENRIREEFGEGAEVETHIEPFEPQEILGKEASLETTEGVREKLSRYAKDTHVIFDVHDVRVRLTATGLMVNYHCRADSSLNVMTVHKAVDFVERRLHNDYPDLVRVIGHAEPLKRA